MKRYSIKVFQKMKPITSPFKPNNKRKNAKKDFKQMAISF